jgi:ParB family chromosome partitioning protein
MAAKKRGLGRGLDALLGSAATKIEPSNTPGTITGLVDDKAPPEGQLCKLPLDLIQRGQYQPRVDMHTDTLDELAESIRVQGVVQPIVVRPISLDKYEIIAGERRWRAAQLAGLEDIPAVVRVVDDRATIAMALIENIQRENLNPIEEARALHRLMHEFELTQQETAEAVGRSRSGVANLLRLLDLNDDVKSMLEKSELEMGHARALLGLKGNEQSEAARQVVHKGLNVRATEQLVRKIQQPKSTKKTSRKMDPNIRHLQDELSEKLGAGVQLQHSGSGKGKLVIQYNSLDELDGILGHIR